MNHLWSPWRMEYIQSPIKPKECIFCTEQESSDGVENLIIFRGKRAYVILNRFPYTSGHLMIVPNAHHASIQDLDIETRTELMELANQALLALQNSYQPEGFNLGINIGEAAGAGIASHVHLHIVPRWGGDTNFMSSVGGTRVLPEALEVTYQRIQQAWNPQPFDPPE